MPDVAYVQQGPLAYRFADDVVIVHLATLPDGQVAGIELPAKVVLDHIAYGRALAIAHGHPPIIDLVQQERDALRLLVDERDKTIQKQRDVYNRDCADWIKQGKAYYVENDALRLRCELLESQKGAI